MAVLRLIAIGTVACNAAGAAPSASGAPAALPAGWKPLPAVVTAVRAAAVTDGVIVDDVAAWGEPARGCYSLTVELHGGAADAPALADQVLDSLPAQIIGAGATGDGRPRGELSELVRPSGPAGVLAFRFAVPPYRGRVRAQLGRGRIAAIACFYNQREPLACEATCTGVLDGAAGLATSPASARGIDGAAGQATGPGSAGAP